MKVHRKNPKDGFIEEIRTAGNYLPKGWRKGWPSENKDSYFSCCNNTNPTYIKA